MNPYDFVPVDWSNPPQRHSPSLHDRFNGSSGKLEGTITAKTPIFIFHSPKSDQGPQPFIKNKQGKHIIPGSSLKGLFRNLVETIGNGCFLLFDESYKRNDQDRNRTLSYHGKLPREFKKCDTDDLCIACRMFGRIPSQGGSSNLHRGNVLFNDAIEVKICQHEEVYTIALMEPKPRHSAFYLNRGRIAGRKFYFHQPLGIQTTNVKSRFNQHIKPIDKGSQFAFSMEFTNLKCIELQTLLYALMLEQNMRHKLGYAKPAGFGSVRFEITKLTLIDYANRYNANRGVTEYKGTKLPTYLSKQTQSFTNNKNSKTLKALRRIWLWDPNNNMQYRYPNRAWFRTNSQKRIIHTP